MAKTNPIGVRFEEDLLLILNKLGYDNSPQQALIFYESCFRKEIDNNNFFFKEFKPILIYCLKNPLDDTIFYVGRTCFPLIKRIKAHISDSKKLDSKEKKSFVINSILREGKLPIIKLLEETIPSADKEYRGTHPREAFWIAKFIKEGHPITNSKSNLVDEEILGIVEKPDPLSLPKEGRDNQFENAARGRDENGINNDEIKIQDATKPTNVIKPSEQQKTNFAINTTRHKKYKEGDPPEGSNAFFIRYGVFTYDEI